MVFEDATKMLDRVLWQGLYLGMVFYEFQKDLLFWFDAKCIPDLLRDNQLSFGR
jgi:hypothetical protein